ncbi:hypothetical protein ACTFIV_007149 [Dictyostelium citrinum]
MKNINKINLFYSMLIIFVFIFFVNSEDINSFLNNDFNIELFKKHQQEKQLKTDQLINSQPDLYSFSSSFLNDIFSFEGSNSKNIDSGSAQNNWIGETCSQTTFGISNSTSCLNDCHQSWGQGVCNEVTSTCECNFFFTGDDCSINIDIDHNFDEINCNGGRYCPPIFDTPSHRKCICPIGQTGIECSICNNNLGCNSLKNNYNDEFTCDNSVYLNSEKSYNCIVTSEEINGDLNNSTASVVMDCQFPEKNYNDNLGECSMNLYYRIAGPPLYFNCTFDQCNLEVMENLTQSITCSYSNCSCSNYCGYLLSFVISSVTGPAKFICNDNSFGSQYDCIFYQSSLSEILPEIPLSCSAGECIDNKSGSMNSEIVFSNDKIKK